MKKARMNISHSRFTLFKLKIFGEIVTTFEDWLCKKLTSLEIDNEVYGSYISGILQDSEESERKDALQEILESLIVSTVQLTNERC